jgi:DNA-binding transcriptional ArsR family regulator
MAHLRQRYIVRGERQLRALASPVRQAIVDVVAATGPSSMKEIGTHLGRPASVLYHHVRALQAVGLLTEQPVKSARGRPGSVFDVPGRPLTIRYEPDLPATALPMRRIVQAMTRAAARDFAKGYRSGVRVSGDARGLWAARFQAWLTEADVREVNRILERLIRVMHRGAPKPGEIRGLHAMTFVLAPMADAALRRVASLSRTRRRPRRTR